MMLLNFISWLLADLLFSPYSVAEFVVDTPKGSSFDSLTPNEHVQGRDSNPTRSEESQIPEKEFDASNFTNSVVPETEDGDADRKPSSKIKGRILFIYTCKRSFLINLVTLVFHSIITLYFYTLVLPYKIMIFLNFISWLLVDLLFFLLFCLRVCF